MRTAAFMALACLLACAEPAADGPQANAPTGTVSPTGKSGNPNTPCHDMASFRAHLLAHGDGKDAQVIEDWLPPRPVTRAERPIIEKLAHQYLALCGGEEVADLTAQLISFPTISDGTAAKDSPAFLAMGKFLRDWSQKNHLHFDNINHDELWELTLGTGPHNLALVTHSDVVPPGVGWSTDPFKATRKGGRLYGRGSEDDKGPMAAVLVVLRALAAMGLEPPGRVSLLIGTSGENDWTAMQRYVHDTPHARNTLSLDASFPVTVAEDAFAAWYLGAPMAVRSKTARPVIVWADAGVQLSQTPGEVVVRLKAAAGQTPADLLKKVKAAAEHDLKQSAKNPFRFAATLVTPPASPAAKTPGPADVSLALKAQGGAAKRPVVAPEAQQVELRVLGKAAHTAVADSTLNPLGPMGRIVKSLDVAPNGAAALLRAAEAMISDSSGKKLGLAHTDGFMGVTVVAPTLLKVLGNTCHLDINIRRPRGTDAAHFTSMLGDAEKTLQKTLDPRLTAYAPPTVGEAAVSTAADALVVTLTSLYRSLAKMPRAQPVSTRANTYARLFSGAVSFGPAVPGKPITGHGVDESIELAHLQFMVNIYLDAVLQLQGAKSL